MKLLVETRSISLHLAQRLIEAAETKAEELGVPMAIAVCDVAGNPVAFVRMDGAALLAIQVARDKAYTAVGFGMSTSAWPGLMERLPALQPGVANMERVIPFPGGQPIFVKGQLVGAIGVSGGTYDVDDKCALAALEELKAIEAAEAVVLSGHDSVP